MTSFSDFRWWLPLAFILAVWACFVMGVVWLVVQLAVIPDELLRVIAGAEAEE